MLSSAITLPRVPVTLPKPQFTFSPNYPSNFPKLPSMSLSLSRSLSPPPPNCLSPSLSPLAGTLKSRLAAGDTLYGLFHLSFSPTLAEIAGLAGYDYVVVDLEHGPGGFSDALSCLHALAATRTPAVLRLPDCSPVSAKKALDLGPQGVMFPTVETVSEAVDAVAACRYAPAGVRGSAHRVVRASGYGIDDGYLENYVNDLLLMVQVETVKGMGNIEAIAAVNGVDCVQMGPLDLSASLGYLWKPGHRKVRELLMEGEKKVLEGGGKGKAYLGGFAMPHDSPVELKRRGYHMVSGAVDVGIFRQALVEDVTRFRKAPGVGGADNGGGQKEEEEEDKGYWSE